MNRRSATTAEFGTRQDQGSKPTMFLGHDALDHLLMAVLDHDPTRCLLIVPADADEDGAMLSPLGGRTSGGVVTARIGHDGPEGHFDYGITGRG